MSKDININTPYGTDSLASGDDQIRSLKQALVDNMSENHIMYDGDLGSEDGIYTGDFNGKHHQVSLYGRSATDTSFQAAYNSIVADDDFGLIYCYDTEYTTEAGTYNDFELKYMYPALSDTSSSLEIQITKVGKINLDQGRLSNNTSLLGRNFSDTADINIVKIDENNNIVINDDLIVNGVMKYDSEFSYPSGSIVTVVDGADVNAGIIMCISLGDANIGNDPTDWENRYLEVVNNVTSTGSYWERLLKRRDLPEGRNALSGIVAAMGTVGSSGVISEAGTGNWSVSRNARGKYQLDIDVTKFDGSPTFLVFLVSDNPTSRDTAAIMTADHSIGTFNNNVANNVKAIRNDTSDEVDVNWSFIAFRIS